jgi:hypothetical protein
MAAFTHTSDVFTVSSVLRNGVKVVSATITVTSAGTDATQITVMPLTRILGWVFGIKNPGTAPTTFVAAAGTAANQISIDPVADATGAVLEITAFGY